MITIITIIIIIIIIIITITITIVNSTITITITIITRVARIAGEKHGPCPRSRAQLRVSCPRGALHAASSQALGEPLDPDDGQVLDGLVQLHLNRSCYVL